MFTVLLEIVNAIHSWPQGALQESSPRSVGNMHSVCVQYCVCAVVSGCFHMCSIVSAFEEISQGLFGVDSFTSLTTHLNSLSYFSTKVGIA